MKKEARKNEFDVNININVQDSRKTIELSNNGDTPIEKIKSHLSVSQLALLCRLLHDLEAISVKNQTDILKFISDNFQTNNAPEISVRSLRSKYYSIDLASKESLKVLLNKMLASIDTY